MSIGVISKEDKTKRAVDKLIRHHKLIKLSDVPQPFLYKNQENIDESAIARVSIWFLV